ncbi:MAG: RluA family pseudouridine synthase [Candidatus Omnitrophota bacterium]
MKNLKRYHFNIEHRDVDKRIDIFLKEKLCHQTSRAYIQYLIKRGQVMVNNHMTTAHYCLKSKDNIFVNYEPRPEIKVIPEDIPFEILYEDNDLLVINKRAGIVVHPGAGNIRGTLANAILAYCHSLSKVGGEIRPGIVHRLDKDTSGILVVAKNDITHHKLAEQFKQHTNYRRYIAIVDGIVGLDNHEINVPISRHHYQRKKMRVTYSGGRAAITRYKVLKRYADYTVLEVTLSTGRTHQIRVHLSHIGHPVLGDALYGKKSQLILRQALHAATLGFIHPTTNEYMEFNAEPPADMQKLIG